MYGAWSTRTWYARWVSALGSRVTACSVKRERVLTRVTSTHTSQVSTIALNWLPAGGSTRPCRLANPDSPGTLAPGLSETDPVSDHVSLTLTLESRVCAIDIIQ